ncbi:high affinity choline transporter 1-like [Actinia tenebrosa]|uniref:High affinity choline transporter 1-like n=1 Tax=Actinia tenebrosa TaxID=6105 RepID=A0A6P8IGT7_ACTTE|nr:high affinity choline transporter 1-like [Actinia tenebrosa]
MHRKYSRGFTVELIATIRNKDIGGELAVVNCFWVIQVSVLVVGTLATLMGLTVADSVYSLFALCSDLVYVVLFPQLCCVTYVPHTNTYGSLAGYVLGLVLRVLEGEPVIGLQPTIKYPYYPDVHDQMFPFRTLLAMACSFVDIVVVSYLMRYLFKKEILPMSMDFPHCFRDYDLKHHEKPKKC